MNRCTHLELSLCMIFLTAIPIAGCTHPIAQSIPTPTASPHPSISVDPQESLFDQIVSIRLSGFEPDQPVTLDLSTLPAGVNEGSSQATFTTDEHGEVDLAKQAPVSGSYHAVDAAGLFWSMKFAASSSATIAAATPSLATIPVFPERGGFLLTASVNGQVVAQATLMKTMGTAGMVASDVREDGLYGTFYRPPGNGPFPAVITLGGSSCGLQTGLISEMLASHGYASLALAYCARYGSLPDSHLPDRIRLIPLEYFGKAIQWLQAQPGVDPDRIGIWGDSRGAEAALWVGATYSQIKAAISIVGYTVTRAGDAAPDSSQMASSWSFEGQGVPFLPANSFAEYKVVHPFQISVNAGKDATTLIPGLVAQMEASPDLTTAAIPVEKINGPILFITGLDDRLVYSSLFAEFAMDRLKTHHFAFPYLHLMVPGAGHDIGGFPNFPQQDHKTEWQTHEWVGGTARADAAADEASWPKVLEYLGMMK